MATPILSLREVGYAYPKGGFRLAGISFSLAEGEKLAIQGPSGAGKSTLLGLIGLLGDGPHEGTYLLIR
ncbi:MAG: ATP-binding cassette domain-containing protein [Bacillota bacterium]